MHCSDCTSNSTHKKCTILQPNVSLYKLSYQIGIDLDMPSIIKRCSSGHCFTITQQHWIAFPSMSVPSWLFVPASSIPLKDSDTHIIIDMSRCTNGHSNTTAWQGHWTGRVIICCLLFLVWASPDLNPGLWLSWVLHVVCTASGGYSRSLY